jgi:FixJ family two-component response regulator
MSSAKCDGGSITNAATHPASPVSDRHEAQLFTAINAALAGKQPAVRHRAAARAAEQMAQLSPRERQVLEAIAAGRPNKLIAYDLGISVRTVAVHRAHMLDRLGVRNIAEAIRIAVMAAVAEFSLLKVFFSLIQ